MMSHDDHHDSLCVHDNLLILRHDPLFVNVTKKFIPVYMKKKFISTKLDDTYMMHVYIHDTYDVWLRRQYHVSCVVAKGTTEFLFLTSVLTSTTSGTL